MSRTESITFQVHPNDEQAQINIMQMFHWNLLSSQVIETKDSHLEKRGDGIYSVTEHSKYIKLAFSRTLDLPNLKDIRQLEQEFNSLHNVPVPASIPGWLIGVAVFLGAILWAAMHIVVGMIVGIIILIVYAKVSSTPAINKANEINSQVDLRRSEILTELQNYD